MRGQAKSHEGYLLNEQERWMEREREGERNDKINIESANVSVNDVICFPTVAFYCTDELAKSTVMKKEISFGLQ